MHPTSETQCHALGHVLNATRIGTSYVRVRWLGMLNGKEAEHAAPPMQSIAISEKKGGARDGARTRDLRRDRPAL